MINLAAGLGIRTGYFIEDEAFPAAAPPARRAAYVALARYDYPMATTADLDVLADGFRRLLSDLPRHESYGPADIITLIADIERLKAGWRPSDEDLADRARIDAWSVQGEKDQEVLFGWISRHPWEPRRRRRSNTSGVVLIDRDLRWARTIGRLYELGAPDNQEQAIALRRLRLV